MTTTTTDRMQSLMDAAYSRWQANKDWSKVDFWDQLDRNERFAVFLGNLTYQVQNGGFAQWWGNRYATPETVGYITRTCLKMGTEASVQVARLVGQAMEHIDDRDENDLDEGEWEDLSDALSELDSAFYEIDDAFLADCEAYLAKQ